MLNAHAKDISFALKLPTVASSERYKRSNSGGSRTAVSNLRSLRRRDSNSIDAAVKHSAEREAIGNQESLNVVVEMHAKREEGDLIETQDFDINRDRLN